MKAIDPILNSACTIGPRTIRALLICQITHTAARQGEIFSLLTAIGQARQQGTSEAAIVIDPRVIIRAITEADLLFCIHGAVQPLN